MYLYGIDVFLDNNLEKTEIYGLLAIVVQQMRQYDAIGYFDSKRTYTPFINGFKDGISISQLIDKLSSLSTSVPDTYGKSKRFTLYIYSSGKK